VSNILPSFVSTALICIVLGGFVSGMGLHCYVLFRVLGRKPKKMSVAEESYWGIQQMGYIFTHPDYRRERRLLLTGWGLCLGVLVAGSAISLLFGTPMPSR